MKSFNEWLLAKKRLTAKEKEEIHRKVQSGKPLDRPYTMAALYGPTAAPPKGSREDLDRIAGKIRALRTKAREI